MKSIFLILFISPLGMAFSQQQSKSSFEIALGQHYYNKTFNTAIPRLEDGYNSKPLYSVSIALSNYRLLISRKIELNNMHMSFTQVIPKAILLDSISMKLSGFSFRQHIGVEVLKKINSMALNLSIGYAAGRVKLYGDKSLSQKNQFFIPEVGIQPRLLIKKITFSISAFYGLDISSPQWRKTWLNSEKQENIESFNQGGLIVAIGLGVRLN